MDAAWRIEVRGIVQGVGFRPFVHRLVTAIGIRGHVRNAGGIAAGFEIVESETAPGAARAIPPDLATCAECLRELFDPANRRYRYPFINCTACGPRATIIESLPYDRARTSMRGFEMCPACAAEYHDPADRRFHAEPIACASCGPRLRFMNMTGETALGAAIDVLASGGVVAVKGLGGFQLVCDAINDEPVSRIRQVKARDAKPLAVMARDLITAGALVDLSDSDRLLLFAPSAPIVLAPRRHGVLAPGVCHGMPDIGVFLPYTPLHHLLLEALRRPLVVTSANHADNPMLIEDVAGPGGGRGAHP
ncbi:Sua5/YciO/YrdC/YwlC family protein [Nonomuraea turcica]|uniref:Sua5/YciO/YrdC/YwlC family protein n=1 Tax=Nonomuraea sp. G32 TaxID=3067274 RepID=UPI00273CE60A|nr:Sua5/YciO/YrdC/YwlC family protein [Nonomuraea sp. G32]MDP4510059.1 Sua5/YciO/YrdC/YwlC family protein [Nonomuraea sp. G32]